MQIYNVVVWSDSHVGFWKRWLNSLQILQRWSTCLEILEKIQNPWYLPVVGSTFLSTKSVSWRFDKQPPPSVRHGPQSCTVHARRAGRRWMEPLEALAIDVSCTVYRWLCIAQSRRRWLWPKSVGAKRSSALDRRAAVVAAAYMVSHGAETRMDNTIHIPVADGSHAKSVPGIYSSEAVQLGHNHSTVNFYSRFSRKQYNIRQLNCSSKGSWSPN